ncbi:MAG: ribosome recycling factor [Candidatus Kerfeldbacteria bacterium RIFOXYA2_FULL_38_24]|uniref:Ribosome recycling factor n=1 Tax=Candidatus Kerfeldbacteria bacterium RIFOXYB2_FULL_38_14 TaxID=1798547 RepID=A0A1G2BCW8_9BACT|nr:MAG: ribosome recycling factor [Candidatus Kerfeldbacteria bacterium RIFOXYA2_FULL_38_24]OGY86037.1 MAG: ribosome recycling factor [Candidatus Kerfeldbacteria bacterium RIFOXYB2_FULL_38_14]OGY90153.1 MAG: ribosome recycling factor [Candidatus Kerfeldbacteria bacterium RIFOXYC2_FULL_38_9]
MNIASFDKVINQLQEDFKTISTNHANPSMIENILVVAYDAEMKLQELATINIAEGQTLVIQPWDVSLIKNIETALRASEFKFNPVVDGKVLRIFFPPLTEEKRKEFVKIMHEKAETARIGIRKIREQILKEEKQKEKDHSISEDEYFRTEKDVQKIVEKYNATIETMMHNKEQELMTV